MRSRKSFASAMPSTTIVLTPATRPSVGKTGAL